MKISDLNYDFPEDLIARSPVYPPRVLLLDQTSSAKTARSLANLKQPSDNELKINFENNDLAPKEISWPEVFELFQPGDLLVMNNSKVVPRRIFSGLENKREILFIREIEPRQWEVLFPVKGMSVGESFELPGGVSASLKKKGRPQIIEVSTELKSDYFFQYGELPLPPYIQKARESRHHQTEDAHWYQTCFAKIEGSLAAPTAGLHFKTSDLENLKNKGVLLEEVTLHVGLGTFLPIQTENVEDHPIHEESFEISNLVFEKIQKVRSRGGRIFALGTTTARVLETLARWELGQDSDRIQIRQTATGLTGETKIYLHPPKKFLWVDGLMTNFHQPGSTLLAMVSAFAGLDQVRTVYKYAIQNKFRLFSYGDFSIWIK